MSEFERSLNLIEKELKKYEELPEEKLVRVVENYGRSIVNNSETIVKIVKKYIKLIEASIPIVKLICLAVMPLKSMFEDLTTDILGLQTKMEEEMRSSIDDLDEEEEMDYI